MSEIEAPAVKSYFFDKGYRDLWATITHSWALNSTEANTEFQRGIEALF